MHTDLKWHPKCIQTAGAVLGKGAHLELIRDSSPPGDLKLLHWHRGTATIAPSVEHAGLTYEPIKFEPSVSEQLLLPTDVAPEESPRELFMAIRRLFADISKPAEPCATLMGLCALVSWIPDALSMVPLLWVNTPPTSPKYVALGLLRALCRRPLVRVGLRRSDLPFLPWNLNPTMLLDEPDLRPAMQAVLHGSSRRSVYVQSGARSFNPYGAKIIFSCELPHEAFLQGDSLKISLDPTDGFDAAIDDDELQTVAKEFQPRLLGFRLRNFHNLRVPDLNADSLTSPTRDVANALCAAVVGDQALMETILDFLKAHEDGVRIDRSNSTRSVLIEALLSFVHENRSPEVRSGELAQRMSAIWLGRGIVQEISAESVGWALKSSGIPGGRVGSVGNGVRLTDAARRQIHELAIAHGVKMFQIDPVRACPYCEGPIVANSASHEAAVTNVRSI